MRDKGLEVFLTTLFGIGGITILLLVWTEPGSLFQRIITTIVGSVGLIWALTKALSLLSIKRRINRQKRQQNVENPPTWSQNILRTRLPD